MFTEEAFRVLLRNRFGGPAKTEELVPSEPDVGALDASPDPATAWVYGIYFCLLDRLPSRLELMSGEDELRSGRPPEELLGELRSAEEMPPDELGEQPDEVYITGCYLSVLGRRPDASGLEFHQALRRSTGSDQAVLDSLMASEEYRLQLRFPPPPSRLDLAIGEALQTVVLGEAPEDQLTEELAAEYRRGVPVLTLVARMMGRDRRLRARIRTFLTGRQLAALVAIEARLRTVERELAAGRQWEWRVNRHTWDVVEELRGQIDGAFRVGLPAGRPGAHR